MAVLPISVYGTQVLRTKAKPVESLDDKIIGLIRDMFETMSVAGGIGLAANQVGIPVQLIVVDISDVEEGKTAAGGVRMALINPVILSQEGEDTMEEGCLSIPGVREMVTRARKIHVRFRDANFELKEMEAEGLLARVILHEYDHLMGVLFIDRIPSLKRTMMKAKLNQIKRGEVEVQYEIVTQEAESWAVSHLSRRHAIPPKNGGRVHKLKKVHL